MRLLLLLYFIVGCASAQSINPVYSVERVLTEQEKLDKKQISVKGYFVFEFENHNLFSNYISYKRHNEKCLSLELLRKDVNLYKKYNKRKVIITGKFIKDFCTVDMICTSSCSQVGLVDITIAQ